jgi:DNA-binding GntR family transcriptional regulator
VDALDQRNLPERIAEHLIDRIAAGEITLGSRILEVPLTEKLGVSRSSLREALRLLEARGVVVTTPQKGAAVRVYEPEGIKTIYSVRETSELRAFSLILARPKALDALVSAVQPIIEEMAGHEGKSNRALNRLDISFHTAMVEAAGEFALSSIWSVIKHHLMIIFSLEITDSSNFADDHRRLIAALTARDWPALEAEYRRHVAKDRLDVQ